MKHIAAEYLNGDDEDQEQHGEDADPDFDGVDCFAERESGFMEPPVGMPSVMRLFYSVFRIMASAGPFETRSGRSFQNRHEAYRGTREAGELQGQSRTVESFSCQKFGMHDAFDDMHAMGKKGAVDRASFSPVVVHGGSV